MGSFPDEQASETLSRIPGVLMDGTTALTRGMPADDLADPADYKEWKIGIADPYQEEFIAPDKVFLLAEDGTKLWDNYTANEKMQAGYIMAPTWLTDNIMVLPGVRVERTEVTSKPRLVELFYKNNPEVVGGGKFVTGCSGNYTDVFPSLRLRFKLPMGLDLRMAGTEAISTPSFKHSVGFADLSSGSTVLRMGNPDLLPTRATNFVILENYLPRMAGVISGGSFRKENTKVAEEQAYADYMWKQPGGGDIEVETKFRSQ